MTKEPHMTTLHILNPTAGRGELPDAAALDGVVHVTECAGDARDLCARELAKTDEEYTVHVYGGDGTLHEVVEGVLAANAGGRVTVVPHPTGSGNDFERETHGITKPLRCDVIKYNDMYAINEVNMGFDTEAVINMQSFKRLPLVNGSLAYILGVAKALIFKNAKHYKVTVTNKNGESETFEGEYLLCIAANGRWYGGGFMAAPSSSVTDGELDLVLVKNVGRIRFIRLVGSYRAGRHIDTERLTPADGFDDIVTFRRCVSVKIEGVSTYSADGEIMSADGVLEVEVIKGAVSVMGEGAVKN